MAPDPALRLALLEAWNGRCVWCRQGLALVEVEVDHLIARSLTGVALADLLHVHGLPADFDVEATVNKVPMHRACNSRKAAKPLPDAPGITQLLKDAATKATGVDADAGKIRAGERLSHAVAVISGTELQSLTQDDLDALEKALTTIRVLRPTPPEVLVGAKPVGFSAGASPCDPVPPQIADVTASFSADRMWELLDEWQDLNADEVAFHAANLFDADGQALKSGGIVGVEKVAYAESIDMFLARIEFSCEYTHFDSDGIGGPADATFSGDMWVVLDDGRYSVIEMEPDLLGSFPN